MCGAVAQPDLADVEGGRRGGRGKEPAKGERLECGPAHLKRLTRLRTGLISQGGHQVRGTNFIFGCEAMPGYVVVSPDCFCKNESLTPMTQLARSARAKLEMVVRRPSPT